MPGSRRDRAKVCVSSFFMLILIVKYAIIRDGQRRSSLYGSRCLFFALACRFVPLVRRGLKRGDWNGNVGNDSV
jgi:hypothetical protein